MNDFHNQRQSDMHTLQRTTGLSEAYLELEGFLECGPRKGEAAYTSNHLIETTIQLSDQLSESD